MLQRLPSSEMDTMNQVQILDDDVCISNIPGKGMNSVILSPAKGK